MSAAGASGVRVCAPVVLDAAGGCPACPAAPGRREALEECFGRARVRELLERQGLDAGLRQALCELVCLEWEQFDAVRGLGGRAGCQDDARSFFVFRVAQYLGFPHELIPLVLGDYRAAVAGGRNPIAEKYARMMRVTDPEHYDRELAALLPAASPVRLEALREVEGLLAPLVAEARRELSRVAEHARAATSALGAVSGLDYFMAEIEGYSLGSIWALRDGLVQQRRARRNAVTQTYENAPSVLAAVEVTP